MRLNEITVGSTVAVVFVLKSNRFEFDLNVIDTWENGIITEPIKLKNGVVNLGESNLYVDIVFAINGKNPTIWHLVTCSKLLKDNQSFYKFSVKTEGSQVNRRSAFRLSVMRNGVAQVGSHTGTNVVLLRDLSVSGFSFITDKQIDKFKNLPVRLSFSEPDYKRDFILTGVVVRMSSNDGINFVYGCRMFREQEQIARYISNKQQKKLERSTLRK